jgi:hypothetical protein
MRAQRLRRLSLLTQGVALITLAGCQKEGASEPPHVNAPAPAPSPTPTTTTAPVIASASASAIDEPEAPTTNAPINKPPKVPKTNSPK